MESAGSSAVPYVPKYGHARMLRSLFLPQVAHMQLTLFADLLR